MTGAATAIGSDRTATNLLAAVLAGACLWAPGVLLAADPSSLQVRFCPASHVRVYPAESGRGIQSLVLQNAIVQNVGKAPAEITEVDIELLQRDSPVDARRLAGADLQQIAAGGPKIQAAGLLQLVGFQFCGKALVPDGVTLAGPMLLSNQAMLLTYQPFLYKGRRDVLRLRVRARSAGSVIEASADLPILEESAKTRFIFPVQGSWFVAVGPTLHTAHRWGIPEEFGFDLVQLGEGTSTHRGTGSRFTDYFAYGAPVRAAASGRVHAVVNGQAEDVAVLRRPDDTDDSYGQRVQQYQAELLMKNAAAGNYVLLDHGNGEYSLYAHLQPGSITVKSGELVKSGQPLGRVGSSGNSTEPHLHFQVCDQPEPLACAGIPIAFEGIDLPYADYPRALQSGDIVHSR